MEKQPIMSQNRNYGYANPGYVPAAQGAPAGAESHGPSAPPATMFESMPGYEGTTAGGGGGFLPPPMPAFPAPQPVPGSEQTKWNIPSISEDTARNAFVQFAAGKCCYSSAPAKDGVITNMEAFNTYRYRLETFTETRSTEWSHEPYNGQSVDALSQPPPGPWDIPAQTPNFFVDGKQIIKVPYTSSVKSCHVCLGMARKPCRECAGAGSVSNFHRIHVKITLTWRDNCSHCQGQGSRQCDTCRGKGQLLVYISLTVKWCYSLIALGCILTNNSDDYVVEQMSGLQVNNLSKVSGKELLRDSQYMVYPVMGFPDPAVVNAAQRLVSEHLSKFSQTSRILQQRQTIELIPITKVFYSWKGKSHIYFVYGNEFQVNADDYPATCCCTVM
ncbi:Protein SSUH2 -like protein ssu-2 -like protein [Channa argus]|uniref:Protein SSUH2-like protein ssu-2-like protein n=1 Tax=Channa argus TaxID=215402 RepID=A0A6G1Q3A7_CHAAH|nr:Protein SSUH2 -like protein ssu-2 -like protein [Channa argus]